MKIFMQIALWTGLSLSLIGCSSVPVNQDYDTSYDFSKIRSVEWLPATRQTEPKASTFEQQNPLIAKRIQNAITEQLQLKGIATRQSGLADAFVTYHYSTKRVLQADPVSTSFGFGMYSRHSGVMFRTSPDIYEYEEGRLVIDIIGRNNQLLWRGISPSRLVEQATPAETTARVNEVVASILAQYPPK